MGNGIRIATAFTLAALFVAVPPAGAGGYKVVDTDQTTTYDDSVEVVPAPGPGQPFHGQDAQYDGHQPSYTLGEDGLTVRDERTGLVWQASADRNGDGIVASDDKLTFEDAQDYPAALNAFDWGGYDDWRLPTIKELYSLILFSGADVSGWNGTDMSELIPFIDTDYFEFGYGDTDAGERLIDAQYWSGTEYVSTTMNGDATAFGVNFADGRIKGYPAEPIGPPGQQFSMSSYIKLVRGNPDYGVNEFVTSGGGTVTDLATGLVWKRNDDGIGRDWEEALAYAEGLDFAGCDDWRLPDAKELQSIVDYTRSPDTHGSAAIDPIFGVTAIVDEGGGTDYPSYWSSTTHANYSAQPGRWAAYLCFGECLGWMDQPPGSGNYVLLDVHGAGSQRSDPKAGDPGDWPNGHGPQGDVVRIYNHVRVVRGEPIAACEIRLEGADATSIELHPTCPAPSFKVVSGAISELRADGGYDRASCLGTYQGGAEDTRADPSPGTGYYYLAEGQDACAVRGYGDANGVTPDPRDALDSGPCS